MEQNKREQFIIRRIGGTTHVSLLSAGCDRNYYTAFCRGERHPITTFLPLKCYLHFCNQRGFYTNPNIGGVQKSGLSKHPAENSEI